MMWNTRLVLLHVISDAFIALAYFSIPLALVVFVRKRKDIGFGFIFWLFSLFIFACGTTHVAAIFTLWHPDYWLEGWLKALTALVSVITAAVLWPSIPKALAIPRMKDLAHARERLETANAGLRAANEKALELVGHAQRSEHAKDEFLAIMSHELRTPISAILGFTDLLGKSSLPAAEQDFVKTIQQSGSSLLRIIDDILNLSSLETGKLPMKSEPMSPAEVADEVLLLLRGSAQARDVRMEVKLAQDLPSAVSADRGRILQILLNLVGNTIKHCAGGEVTLSVGSMPGASAKDVRIEYRVSDTGPGILPGDLTHIFEPFTQLDHGHSRRQPGVGLGLPISQRLARLLGGSLSCTSTPGEGSTFTFLCEFPLAEPSLPAAAPGEPAMVKARPLRLMVAEDDAINRKLIVIVLKRMGYTPSVAKNGAEAVALYSAEPHDCILMDMQMPEIDGMAATRAIRKLEAAAPGRQPAYIIAVTANGLPADREHCLEAGMNEVLTKPLHPTDLEAALERAADALHRRPL